LQTSSVSQPDAKTSPGNARRVFVPLAGAAILAGLAIASLPWKEGFGRPRTPFDRSAAYPATPVFALLSEAAKILPTGASVVVQTEPRDAGRETEDHRFAVALLPGRVVLPAAEYGRFLPSEVWTRAEYVVVLGGRPADAPGELLLETGDGTIWKRTTR
jgi:hypothetical protein